MGEPGKAVFLSYASQDAEAARRIAEALHAAGVEVWFDQAELRGGDAWDQKIRKQIKECALFIPIISANTQARLEGYFRREWRMAVERMHDMDDDMPFLVPVVIDDTPDAAARVPERFRERQWTRLPGGETSNAFVDRVQRLLAGEHATVPHAEIPRAADRRTARRERGRRRSPWLTAFFIVVGVGTGAFYAVVQPWLASRTPGQSNAADVPVSEADQLVRQARELIADPDAARHEFALAEDLLARATTLAPNSAAAWGASSLASYYTFFRAYDTNRERLTRSRADAEKALRLDPRNVDALLALGLQRQEQGETDRAKELLDRALAADPQNSRVLLAQSMLIRDRRARADFLLDAAQRVANPAELYHYAGLGLFQVRRAHEAIALFDRSLAAQPFWRTYVIRAFVEYVQSADPAKMEAWLARISDLRADEPRVAIMRYKAAMLRRDGTAAARALEPLTTDFIEDNYFVGPKAFLLAQAHEIAGRNPAAREQWLAAERAVRERLAAQPGNTYWRSLLAVILTGTGQRDEARTAAEACASDDERVGAVGASRLSNSMLTIENTAQAFTRLGDTARALEVLRAAPLDKYWGYLSVASLAADPMWAPLRDQPGYAELRTQLERLERSDGNAAPPTAAATATSDAKSIAVLPFANLSPDPDNAFFCDGMHEDVLTALAKVRELRVISRTSVLRYRDSAARNLREIAAELGVRSILEGSVRRAGNKVRITAQLINASTDEHLWAETYDRDLTDVFALQSELAQKIAGSLHATLSPPEQAELDRAPTRDLQAYDLYLRARTRFSTEANSPELARETTALLDDAVRRDPEFVLAWAELAKLSAAFYGDRNADPTPERLATAERALAEAVRRAPRAPEVLIATGAVALFGRNEVSDARQSLRDATVLRPNSADAWNWLGLCEIRAGNWAEAAAAGERALQLQPDSIEAGALAVQALTVLRHYERAWEVYQQVAKRSPVLMRLVPRRFIRLAADGDFDAFLADLTAERPDAGDAAEMLDWEYEMAYWRQDFTAVAAIAAQHGNDLIGRNNFVLPAPLAGGIALHLAGDRDGARVFASRALALLTAAPTPHLNRAAQRRLAALCHALLGEADSARRAITEAATLAVEHGGPAAITEVQYDQLHVPALLGSRDDTLALLRTMLAEPFPYGAPNILRHDPILVVLFGDDPRFEEALQSAKRF